jgi:hypothetical protein
MTTHDTIFRLLGQREERSIAQAHERRHTAEPCVADDHADRLRARAYIHTPTLQRETCAAVKRNYYRTIRRRLDATLLGLWK